MLFAERTQDFAFYLRVTEELEPDDEVLELGIGDGRVALVLAEHGRNVHGVDASPHMIAALDRRVAELSPKGRISREVGDTRTVRVGRRFARVICPFNGIAHFHDHEALSAFFRTVRAHLADGGIFAFDAIIPDPALMKKGSSAFVPWVRHPRTGAICRVEESYAYDGESRVLTITTNIVERETESTQVLRLALRQFFPEEMPALLARHGFTLERRTPEIGDALAYVCR